MRNRKKIGKIQSKSIKAKKETSFWGKVMISQFEFTLAISWGKLLVAGPRQPQISNGQL
jgi:hypothetical protein